MTTERDCQQGGRCNISCYQMYQGKLTLVCCKCGNP